MKHWSALLAALTALSAGLTPPAAAHAAADGTSNTLMIGESSIHIARLQPDPWQAPEAARSNVFAVWVTVGQLEHSPELAAAIESGRPPGRVRLVRESAGRRRVVHLAGAQLSLDTSQAANPRGGEVRLQLRCRSLDFEGDRSLPGRIAALDGARLDEAVDVVAPLDLPARLARGAIPAGLELELRVAKGGPAARLFAEAERTGRPVALDLRVGPSGRRADWLVHLDRRLTSPVELQHGNPAGREGVTVLLRRLANPHLPPAL